MKPPVSATEDRGARTAEGSGKGRKLLGALGEEAAAEHLERNGYSILERNYRSRIGEIDIIARHGEDIVFVEVKTRKSSRFGLGEEAVGRQKQVALARLAAQYLAQNRLGGLNCRFDVVVIRRTGAPVFEIEHIPNAFGVGGSYTY